MHRRKINVLQRVGLALILGGTGLIICSVDPYSNDLITNLDLLVRAVQAGMLMAGGWILYRPWKDQEDETDIIPTQRRYDRMDYYIEDRRYDDGLF